MNIFGFFSKTNINDEIENMRNTPGAVLIDVRTEEEYRTGHIPQAVNVPLDKISEFRNRIKNPGTPIYVYCLRGSRSQRAAGILKGYGYTNVKSIGGITSYKGKLEK